MVAEHLELDPLSGHLFAFCNRKKRSRKSLPEDLPRVEEVHDIDDKDKVCGCGCELKRIGEETSEKLDIIPAKIQVIHHIRPKYACPECEGVKDDGPFVMIAPVHPQIIPKFIVSPGLLAHILIGKSIDHTPFYRQEQARPILDDFQKWPAK